MYKKAKIIVVYEACFIGPEEELRKNILANRVSVPITIEAVAFRQPLALQNRKYGLQCSHLYNSPYAEPYLSFRNEVLRLRNLRRVQCDNIALSLHKYNIRRVLYTSQIPQMSTSFGMTK